MNKIQVHICGGVEVRAAAEEQHKIHTQTSRSNTASSTSRVFGLIGSGRWCPLGQLSFMNSRAGLHTRTFQRVSSINRTQHK